MEIKKDEIRLAEEMYTKKEAKLLTMWGAYLKYKSNTVCIFHFLIKQKKLVSQTRIAHCKYMNSIPLYTIHQNANQTKWFQINFVVAY